MSWLVWVSEQATVRQGKKKKNNSRLGYVYTKKLTGHKAKKKGGGGVDIFTVSLVESLNLKGYFI